MRARQRVTRLARKTGLTQVRALREQVSDLEEALREHAVLQERLDAQVERLEAQVADVLRRRRASPG